MKLTRRSLICALPAVCCRAESYPNYPRCLPDFLRGLAADACARRAAAIEELRTAERVEARQQWARATFWKLIGGMPERTPLAARTTGGFERERYRLEKLVYQSRPGEWISANLYLPKAGSPPFPGVLFQMGHSVHGKAEGTYQSCCQGLAQLGFAVLAFDPLGQGERTNYPGPDGLTRLGSADAEHTLPGKQLLLAGETITRLMVWDAVRSLDVLASHPLVDARRLASAGQSGGGTLTMMLAAVEERLAAAVVSSGNTENVACPDFLPPGSVDDAEQNFINSGPLGFDRWDLLWPFAPRPLLILSSAKDFFGTYSPNYEANGRQEFARLQAAYRVLGKEKQLAQAETPAPHALSYFLRLQLYEWLSRWLKGDDSAIAEEPPVAPEPDNRLWAGPTGNVVRDFGSATPVIAARGRLRPLPRRPPGKQPDLRGLLNIERVDAAPQLRVLGAVPFRGGKMLAVDAETASGVHVPAWVLRPDQRVDKLIFIIEPGGRNQRWGTARSGSVWPSGQLSAFRTCGALAIFSPNSAPALPAMQANTSRRRITRGHPSFWAAALPASASPTFWASSGRFRPIIRKRSNPCWLRADSLPSRLCAPVCSSPPSPRFCSRNL